MKRVLSIFLTALIVLSFTSCGSDEIQESDTSTSIDAEESSALIETMVIDESYTLDIGEEIQKISDDARVKIIQNSEDTQASYVLTVGSAEILRN